MNSRLCAAAMLLCIATYNFSIAQNPRGIVDQASVRAEEELAQKAGLWLATFVDHAAELRDLDEDDPLVVKVRPKLDAVRSDLESMITMLRVLNLIQDKDSRTEAQIVAATLWSGRIVRFKSESQRIQVFRCKYYTPAGETKPKFPAEKDDRLLAVVNDLLILAKELTPVVDRLKSQAPPPKPKLPPEPVNET